MSWRDRFSAGNIRVSREAALRSLPTVIEGMTPVGVVRNSIQTIDERAWVQVPSELVFLEEFGEALTGLEGFSHIFVLSYLDRVTDEGRVLRRSHPGDHGSPLELGVFASRTAHRPNPIAISIVRLEEIDGNVVKVEGLDVANRTPVLDVKPYVPFYDSFEAKIPNWAE